MELKSQVHEYVWSTGGRVNEPSKWSARNTCSPTLYRESLQTPSQSFLCRWGINFCPTDENGTHQDARSTEKSHSKCLPGLRYRWGSWLGKSAGHQAQPVPVPILEPDLARSLQNLHCFPLDPGCLSTIPQACVLTSFKSSLKSHLVGEVSLPPILKTVLHSHPLFPAFLFSTWH